MSNINVGFTEVTPDTWNGVYPLEDLPAFEKGVDENHYFWSGKYTTRDGMYSGESCRGFGLMVLDATYGVDKCTHYGKKTNMTTDEKYKQFIRGLSNGSMFTVTWAPGKGYSGDHTYIKVASRLGGVTVYDCNFVKANEIRKEYLEWSEFTSRFDTVKDYFVAPKD